LNRIAYRPSLKFRKNEKDNLIHGLSILTIIAVHAQKWSELTQEQKVMKAKELRAG
jgi:hypothetical protein